MMKPPTPTLTLPIYFTMQGRGGFWNDNSYVSIVLHRVPTPQGKKDKGMCAKRAQGASMWNSFSFALFGISPSSEIALVEGFKKNSCFEVLLYDKRDRQKTLSDMRVTFT